MDENNRYHRKSKLGLRNAAGDGKIVEVEGGHIIRSTSQKDRHSKVLTAKGARDRRIRLSANTAIQFYDVQSRLGYDRPSKAVDWLIKKAKASIDELAELPPWKPATADTAKFATPVVNLEQDYYRLSESEEHPDDGIVYNHMGSVQDSSFFPASLDSIKSFFPTGGSSTPASINASLAIQFHHSYSQNPDLNLSVQSSQGSIFGGSGLPENDGFNISVFNSPETQTTPFLLPLVEKPTNSQLLNYISQRRSLQSSNSPRVCTWVNPSPFSGDGIHQDGFHNQTSMPGFNSGMIGFSGFNYQEEQDGISNKPSCR